MSTSRQATHITVPITLLKCLLAIAAAGLLALPAHADAPQSASPKTTIVYFVRHGEDTPELVNFHPSITVTFNHTNAAGTCSEEVLNPLGLERATRLAQWFKAQRITDTLTHVIASHKVRTRQTVQEIAFAAGLGGDLDGDGDLDGTDVDQVPGDGVINVPSTPFECDAGFTGASSARQPQIDYIKSLPVGSRAVVCTHSPVMYPLMQAFGIDTSDPVTFPKSANGRVSGFNNLWIVQLDKVNGVYQGRLLQHLYLNLSIEPSVENRENGRATGHIDRDE